MKLSSMKDWFTGQNPSPTAPMAFRSAAKTHIGLVRSVNEDRLLDRPDRGLWAVADGMGGHEGGDVAATIAVRALEDIANQGQPTIDDVVMALDDANLRIFERFGGRGTSGCTVAGLLAADQAAMAFWIGDSRVYRRRGGAFDLLTHDHSLVQELVDGNVLTRDQARRHPQANVITRALGASQAAEPGMTDVSLAEGDRFLLCTDGLWGMVSDEGLDASMSGDPLAAVTRLTASALDAGGCDNIAMIVVDISFR